MNSKKLAYLASEFPGISHTFIFREIQALTEQGFTVETASIRQAAHLEKMTKAERERAAETCYIKSTNPLKALAIHLILFLRSPFKYTAFFFRSFKLTGEGRVPFLKTLAYIGEAGILARWMEKKGVRHVHVHFANPAATVAMLASLLGKIEYSLSIHGPDIFYDITTNMLTEKIHRASAVRCISHYCKSQLERLVPHEMWSKFTIVRCGVNVEKFAPRKEPNNSVPEILCLGRLVPAKGQHILLEALKILNDRSVPFHLNFVGDGDDRSSLERLTAQYGLNDSVTFVGAVGQDEVHQFYDGADIFVLPSFAEGVPVVLMEAMAKEIPAVSTDITGIPELIEHGKDGILAIPSDIEGLANHLQTLLEDPERRRTLGKQGRAKVLENYDLTTNCGLMADFLKDSL
ncbi:MAG: glycosyltransferase family 4 protein [Spirochaetales bacterium]|nr:glycosyltransferase family 4 protein [Spirochaetales bacterium]